MSNRNSRGNNRVVGRVSRGGSTAVHDHTGLSNADILSNLIDKHYVRKPTNRNLPSKLEAIIPEAKLYQDLQAAERRIDATISRKRLDLQDILARSVRKTETLRVFVSNTCTDQPWQSVSKLDENAFDFDTGVIPSWNLRVEGRLVDDVPAEAPERKRFSSFFTSIVVELDSNDEYPIDGNIVEWHEPINNNNANNVEFDVLDIRRKGDHNVNARITLQPKEYPDKFKLSPQLAETLALEEETKPGIILAMWQYIKFHKLQDVEEKRKIKCDAALKSLFNMDSISFPQIMDYLTPHLQQRDPIVLNYTIRVDKENTLGDYAYDIEIEVEDPTKQQMAELLENWYSNQQDIQAIDDEIALTVKALGSSKLRRDFFTQMSENPSLFIQKWLSSQSRDLRIISGDKGFNEEEVRKSSFYDDEKLSQSVHLFLNTRNS